MAKDAESADYEHMLTAPRRAGGEQGDGGAGPAASPDGAAIDMVTPEWVNTMQAATRGTRTGRGRGRGRGSRGGGSTGGGARGGTGRGRGRRGGGSTGGRGVGKRKRRGSDECSDDSQDEDFDPSAARKRLY